MINIKNKVILTVALTMACMFSCQDLVELNENPNGVDPASAHPNLLLSTVTTEAGKAVVNLGYGDIAGVMQHTLKDGWGGGHNTYEWANQGWGGYYGILRNNNAMYQKAVEMELEFHQGVGLVMKSFVFGMIADLWGDAPYSAALKGELGGVENIQPVFDSQQAIYAGIFADLEEANALLSKSAGEYSDINPAQDLIYSGDPARWRKFANSLALRYYMRISMKDPSTAKAGIEKIVGNPSQYPIITAAADDANLQYLGNNSTDSWPANTVFDATQESNFRRIKMCATLVDTMRLLNDPRLALWAAPVEIPLVIDPDAPEGTDEIRADGKRYVSQDIADDYQADYGVPLDTNQDFVGLNPGFESFPSAYNLSPDLQQASFNPHVSWLNDRYRAAGGSLLKGRMLSAAETHFILAEAALKGWAVGSAQDHYQMAIRNSFIAWGIGGMYDDYIAGPAAYDGTLEQIMTQKWIASWTAAAEAWFDYRRTGYPALQAPYAAKRTVPPVRFYYSVDELDLNPNGADALENLEQTQYTLTDGANSAWSKPWVLQGTGVPW
jgi:hypothetical protein